MLLRNEAKVGLIVFIAILVLIAVYWFLGSLGLRTSTYPVYAVFPNARTLDKGADVRMAGVRIGVVSSIRLVIGKGARVNMLIFNGNDIPEDSVAQITAAGLIGDNYVEILPGKRSQMVKNGGRLSTKETVQMDELISQTSDLLAQLKVTTANVNQILGDKQTVANVKAMVVSLKQASDHAVQFMASAQSMLDQTSPQVRRVFANLETATANASDISTDLKDMIDKQARPNVGIIMAQARQAATNLNNTIIQAQQLIATAQQGSGAVGITLSKINSAATEAEQMMHNLNEASGGIRDLATDKQLQANFKCTIANAAETSEQAKQLMTCLNRKFGCGKQTTPAQRSAIPDAGTSINALYNTGKGEYRFDADYTFGMGGNDFYRLGAYNIGENTRLNLQAGKVLGPNSAFRYGLYASRVGVGFNQRFTPKLTFSGDLFRPNDPELELRSIYSITDSIGLYGGIDDLFDPNARDLMIGVHYRR